MGIIDSMSWDRFKQDIVDRRTYVGTPNLYNQVTLYSSNKTLYVLYMLDIADGFYLIIKLRLRLFCCTLRRLAITEERLEKNLCTIFALTTSYQRSKRKYVNNCIIQMEAGKYGTYKP